MKILRGIEKRKGRKTKENELGEKKRTEWMIEIRKKVADEGTKWRGKPGQRGSERRGKKKIKKEMEGKWKKRDYRTEKQQGTERKEVKHWVKKNKGER